MPLTVAEVVGSPVIRAGDPEVLCAQGFDREVRWVHVSDVGDLSDLLRGGEMVLTTGAALCAEPASYLSGLAEVGVVAVVAELTWQTPRGLARLGECAAAVGLALVALRRVIRFVEVTEEVHRRLVAEQYAEVAFARRVHEVFTALTVRHAEPAEITAHVSDLLDTPVVLENLTHQAVASAGGAAETLLHDWERRSRLNAATAGPATGPERWASVPVGQEHEHWARLVALNPPDDATRTAMVLERAAQALVMYRMAERGRLDLERHAQAGLIEDISAGRLRDERAAAARATALGLRASAEYVPVSLVVPAWPEGPDPVATRHRTARLLDTVVRAVRSAGHSGLFWVRDGGEVRMVLALAGRGAQAEQVEGLALQCRRDILRATGCERALIGVGPPARAVIPAVAALSEAAHVAEVAAAMPGGDRAAFTAADIRVRGLVTLLRDDPRVTRFAESELRALLLDDLEHGHGLLEVLRGYLQLAGNKSALAARLHMSRAALYVRLARIERVLGVDLSDGESMTSLHVALLILDAPAART